MKKGDKFIVVRKGHEIDGKVVIFISYESGYGFFEYKGNLVALPFHSIKPYDRFPCDDEQNEL